MTSKEVINFCLPPTISHHLLLITTRPLWERPAPPQRIQVPILLELSGWNRLPEPLLHKGGVCFVQRAVLFAPRAWTVIVLVSLFEVGAPILNRIFDEILVFRKPVIQSHVELGPKFSLVVGSGRLSRL